MTTELVPFTLGFGPGGEPLGTDGRPLIQGVIPAENGVILRTEVFVPVDHPSVSPFDLAVIREETYTLSENGTLDLVVVLSGITFDEFVELNGGGTSTLSRMDWMMFSDVFPSASAS